MVNIIQVTLINGQQFSVEVKDFKQFKKLRRKGTWRKGGFFILCKTCSIKRSSVSTIEYFENVEKENEDE